MTAEKRPGPVEMLARKARAQEAAWTLVGARHHDALDREKCRACGRVATFIVSRIGACGRCCMGELNR